MIMNKGIWKDIEGDDDSGLHPVSENEFMPEMQH